MADIIYYDAVAKQLKTVAKRCCGTDIHIADVAARAV